MPGAGVRVAARDPEDGSLTATTLSAAAPTSDALLARILTSLDDDKAEEVVSIDLRGRSAMADHMVIASGRSARQVGAIAEKLVDRLKEDFGRRVRIEGKETGDWVLVDADDVVVHIFRPEVREFYALEKMWMPADALGALRAQARADGIAPPPLA